MGDCIRIAGLVEESIVDGPGIRFVVFTQGCPHNCPGCHNPNTHDPNGGYIADIEDVVKKIRKNKLVQGVTISGGDPFYRPKEVLNLVKRLKNFNYHVVVYSGYTLEELIEKAKNNDDIKNLLLHIDMLIDGRFEKDKQDYTLKFRGSSNQRIIDMKDVKFNFN